MHLNRLNPGCGRRATSVALALLLATLVACGGGGSDSSTGTATTPPVAGDPPVVPGPPSPPASTPTQPNPVPAGYVSITKLVQQAAANIKYFVQTVKAAATDEVAITLPPAPLAVGDTITVKGDSDIRWKILQNAGQTIGTRALPGGVEPGLNFTEGTNSTSSWWFVASSASGQKLAAVGNAFPSLHPGGTAEPGRVRISADGGLNWTELNTPDTQPPANNWASIASSADGTKLAVTGFSTGIWTSGDSGATWTNNNSLLQYFPGDEVFKTEFVSVSMSADGSRMVAATLDTAEPAGTTNIPANGRIFTFQQTPGAAFGVGTWTQQTDPKSIRQWRGVAMSADGKTLVAAAHIDRSAVDAGVYISTDFGATWAYKSVGTGTEPSPYRVAISADGTRMIMAERFGKIFVSSDSGAQWSAGISDGGFNAVACSADGLTMMAVQANGFVTAFPEDQAAPSPERNGKLLVSINGGTSFINRSTSPRWYRGAAMSADGNRLAAAVDGGPIYVSTSNRTTLGTAGFITGGQTNEIALRYLGDGLFNVFTATGTGFQTK